MTKRAEAKECETCSARYRPRGNNQRWCSSGCKPPRPCANSACSHASARGGGRWCPRCAARLHRNGHLELLPRRKPEPIVTPDGYVKAWVGEDHPAGNAQGYAYVHRQVMAEHIGRPLYKFETVHHKNGKRDDNRLSNLELWAKPQLPGQRVDDLVAFVVEHYPERVRAALDGRAL